MGISSPTDVRELAYWIKQASEKKQAPLIIAVDGRSGVGKSTLASMLKDMLDAAIIEGDDFYAGGIGIRSDSAVSRAAACIDYIQQRTVLEALSAGRNASWRAFDWEAFDGRLCDEPTRMASKPVIILEGVYSARPELADLIDIRIVISVRDELRMERLIAREGSIGPWERQWHEAEEIYFSDIMPTERFDVICQW